MIIEGEILARPVGPLEDLLRIGLRTNPDGIALTSSVQQLTWNELEEASSALAAQYAALGLRPGDRLASLMPNRVELLIHYLACFKSGIVLVPLNYRYTAREIDHALEVSAASALIVHAERSEDVAASQQAQRLSRGLISYEGELEGARRRFEEMIAGSRTDSPISGMIDPTSPAAIFFTSGSTGPAKGVTHTHESLRWMFASAAAAFELTPSDIFMPGSSMSHIGSFIWALASLSLGARVLVVRNYDADEVLPLLREHHPTLLAMLPAALAALIRDNDVRHDDFSSLRICRSGADKVSTELLSEFAALAGFPIDEGYGMTEVGLATLNPPSGTIKQGSIGIPIAGCSISIRGSDSETVPTGNVGRVWIKSRSRMSGYWNAPDATHAVVRQEWLDSGDLARADDDGYLWFFGRKKQIIVHDGSNISPLEIEAALLEHPTLALAGVVGIHDEVHGENVRAYVTLRDGVSRPSSDELIQFCRARVGYKAPEEVVILDEMPLNPTGKVDRANLKRLAEDHLHPHGID